MAEKTRKKQEVRSKKTRKNRHGMIDVVRYIRDCSKAGTNK